MPVRKLKDDVFAVGYIDWDRDLFEDLSPLPEGTSYNSYFIKGSEKTALLDTVDAGKAFDLFKNLDRLKVDQIDYIIIHHAEQDHTGSLPEVLEKFPMAKVVTNKKCMELLLLHFPTLKEDDFQIIENEENLSLGNKKLKFYFTPWVHWPETMISYLVEDKILFTGDFLGGHVTSNKTFVSDPADTLRESKLYFADILMPFRANIRKHLKIMEDLDYEMIAPSHGQVHDQPEFIVNAYKDWVSDNVKNLVLIPYATTHGAVENMVMHLVDALTDRGIEAKPYHVTRTDIGSLSVDLVDAATVVMGSSTYIMGPHPEMAYIAFLVNLIRPKVKNLSFLISYGWASRVKEVLSDMMTNIKPNVLEPVIIKGVPTEEAFANIERLADDIANAHKELGIL